MHRTCHASTRPPAARPTPHAARTAHLVAQLRQAGGGILLLAIHMHSGAERLPCGRAHARRCEQAMHGGLQRALPPGWYEAHADHCKSKQWHHGRHCRTGVRGGDRLRHIQAAAAPSGLRKPVGDRGADVRRGRRSACKRSRDSRAPRRVPDLQGVSVETLKGEQWAEGALAARSGCKDAGPGFLNGLLRRLPLRRISLCT
jgi:hypothetical protein